MIVLILAGSVLAALVLCALFVAAGARARSIARAPVRPSLQAPVDLLIGTWVLGSLALAAGVLGLFHAATFAAILIAMAAAGRWKRARFRRLARSWPLSLPAALLLPIALAPPFFYDALVYHLGLPWQAILEGRLAPHPENLFSTFPPLAQLVYAAPIAFNLDRVPALLHLAAFLAAGMAAASLARLLGSPPGLAALAGATLLLLPAIYAVPAFPAAEGWCAAGVIASTAIVAGDARGRRERAAALLAGLFAGIAAGARLQGLSWAVILFGILAGRVWTRAGSVLLSVAGLVAGASCWWLKNLVLLGDPLAPLGWQREGIETLWRDGGVRMHPWPGLGPLLRSTASAIEPHAEYVIPLALAAVLALVRPGRARRAWVGAAAAAGTLAWAVTGSLPRFWLPSLGLLLALAASAGASALPAVETAARGRRRAASWASALALLAAAAPGLVVTSRAILRWGGPRLVLERWPSDLGGLVIDNPMPAFAEAASLPPGAKVLFVGETRGFRFPHSFVAPSQHDTSPLRQAIESSESALAARTKLVDQGYTHLLLNRAELKRLIATYPAAPWSSGDGRRRFSTLLDELSPAVVEAGGVEIFDLRNPGRSDHQGG